MRAKSWVDFMSYLPCLSLANPINRVGAISASPAAYGSRSSWRASPCPTVRFASLWFRRRGLCGDECPHIGELGDPFVGGPVTVRALRFDAHQRGPVTSLSGLQRGDILKRMTRYHAVIVVCGCDQHGRIASALLEIVQR